MDQTNTDIRFILMVNGFFWGLIACSNSEWFVAAFWGILILTVAFTKTK